MKVLLCVCVLIAVVFASPVAKEEVKEKASDPVNFAPVEVAEDHAGEEGVDLKPAENYGFGYGYRRGGYGYGHHRPYYGGYRRFGWGGHGSYSRESFSSEYFG
ncbi:hypothetical protein DMENIID0001_117480 [Sergentomyia squamirostris]